jgi:RecG-like helicase
VNIELKKRSTEEKITTQLIRNKYYLNFLNRNVHCYTYVVDDNKIYTLDAKNELEESSHAELLDKLACQDVIKLYEIDSYFNPSNYLVSPFNSTEEFIKGKYFLTTHQEEIKSEVLKQLSSPNYSIIAIKGNAGTGKTLLTYDIAKEVLNKREILVIHCGYLNDGQIKLKEKYGWNIVAAKDIMKQNLSKYHLIVVDEVQRIYPYQFEYLITKIKTYANNIIFSYDGQQTLRKWEITNNITEKIESAITSAPYELTNKIRTNKEVASFIQCLFSQRRGLEKHKYQNIEFNYFDNYTDAKSYMEQLRAEDWKIINFTPSKGSTLPYDYHSLYDEPDNAHTVIGQEFDNVVAVMDGHFYYKNGYLSTRNYKNKPYYHPTKMLLQIVSRTRIKLSVVIISNHDVLNRCMEILNQK